MEFLKIQIIANLLIKQLAILEHIILHIVALLEI